MKQYVAKNYTPEPSFEAGTTEVQKDSYIRLENQADMLTNANTLHVIDKVWVYPRYHRYTLGTGNDRWHYSIDRYKRKKLP